MLDIVALNTKLLPAHTGPLVDVADIEGKELMVIIALLVIFLVQLVPLSVATTVYVADAVNVPKLNGAPVPAIGAPAVDAPLYS